MSCKRFSAAIAAQAAGAEIDGAAARHVSGCAACRERLEAQRRLLAELDAEIGRTLSIGASPDFVARAAAAALEAERTPARRWVPAPLWAGFAVAAAIVMAVWIHQPAVVDSPGASDARVKVEATQAARPAPAVPPPAFRPKAEGTQPHGGSPAPAAARSRVRAFARSRVPALSPDPPVIVEPDQAVAIARLYQLARQGRLTEEMLPPVQPHEAAELSVEPLRIPEITVPDVQGAGHAPGSALERD
jgi:hypothetical protein